MVIEAYNPCRFSQQFGFYQVMPCQQSEEILEAKFANVLCLWIVCPRHNIFSQVYFLVCVLNPHTQVTQCYKTWWLAKNGNYLEEGIQYLVESASPPPSKPKFLKKISDDNGGKNSENSYRSNDDRHWKRLEKSNKPSICYDKFFVGFQALHNFVIFLNLW